MYLIPDGKYSGSNFCTKAVWFKRNCFWGRFCVETVKKKNNLCKASLSCCCVWQRGHEIPKQQSRCFLHLYITALHRGFLDHYTASINTQSCQFSLAKFTNPLAYGCQAETLSYLSLCIFHGVEAAFLRGCYRMFHIANKHHFQYSTLPALSCSHPSSYIQVFCPNKCWVIFIFNVVPFVVSKKNISIAFFTFSFDLNWLT